jgi:RNA polymerase sigma-70 factor (ECF subfamily)
VSDETLLPGEPQEEETLELLGRIRAGEADGWRELYERYHDPMLFWIRAHLGAGLRRHLQSEDVLQSAAMAWFRDLERFEYRGKGSLHAFLRRLILNKIRDRADFFAAQKRGEPETLDESRLPAEGAAVAYRDAATYEALEEALAALPEDLRQVVLLHKVDGLPTKEIAAQLGKSDDAVRKTYSRAIARLALRMGSGGGSGR